jgi:hypothetical protein
VAHTDGARTIAFFGIFALAEWQSTVARPAAQQTPPSPSASVAIAHDFAKECSASYAVAVIAEVMGSCKDLRVTGQGMRLADELMQRKEPQDCMLRAKNRVEGEMMKLGVRANPNVVGEMEETPMWCDYAQGELELLFRRPRS